MSQIDWVDKAVDNAKKAGKVAMFDRLQAIKNKPTMTTMELTKALQDILAFLNI